jgi:hypothetical protein
MSGPDGYLYFCNNNRDGRGNPVTSDDRISRPNRVELPVGVRNTRQRDGIKPSRLSTTETPSLLLVDAKLCDPEILIGINGPEEILEFRVEELVGLNLELRLASLAGYIDRADRAEYAVDV